MNDLGISQLLAELAEIRGLSELFASFSDLSQSVKDTLSLVGVFTLIFGVLQCFFGYKLIKLWCAFIGFVLGCIAGAAIAAAIVASGLETPGLIVVLIMFTMGMLGGLLAYRAYIVGVFLYAFSAAFLVGFALISLITNSIYIGLIAGLLMGIAMGVIAAIYRRFWIIAATSVSGGISAGAGFMLIIQNADPVLSFIIPVVFIIAGFFVQYKTTAKDAGKPAKNIAASTAPAAYPAVPPQGYPPDPSQVYPPAASVQPETYVPPAPPQGYPTASPQPYSPPPPPPAAPLQPNPPVPVQPPAPDPVQSPTPPPAQTSAQPPAQSPVPPPAQSPATPPEN